MLVFVEAMMACWLRLTGGDLGWMDMRLYLLLLVLAEHGIRIHTFIVIHNHHNRTCVFVADWHYHQFFV